MKVLIFGIGGFVGHYLAEEFHQQGYDVCGCAVSNRPSIPEYTDFAVANLLDSEIVYQVIAEKKPDMIINLAAISSVGQSWNIPQSTISVNVVGALNILEAARKIYPMPKVMFIGSSEEYAVSDKPISENDFLNANNPYGISKITQEKFVELYRNEYGMKTYYVRPFNHTGVGQRDTFVLPSFCKQAAEIEISGKPGVIRVGNLAAKRDFSHVKDVVRAYRMIIESEDCGSIYNVGSGKTYSLRELLQYIISLSTQNITVEVDPERFRPIDTPLVCCDKSKIAKELGWQPQYTVYDALKEMYYHYLNINKSY